MDYWTVFAAFAYIGYLAYEAVKCFDKSYALRLKEFELLKSIDTTLALDRFERGLDLYGHKATGHTGHELGGDVAHTTKRED